MPKVTKAQEWLWRDVFAEYNGCCAGCASSLDLEYDHVVPRKVGGSNASDNIQILCHHCNNAKNGTLGLDRMPPRLPEYDTRRIVENRAQYLAWLKTAKKYQTETLQ